MDAFFRVGTFTVPTAASAYAVNTPDVAAAGDQCLTAFGLVAMMVVVLPIQTILEVVPLTIDEMAKELTKHLDEAVKELVKP